MNNTIHPNAKLADNVEVGPYTTIAEHVEIGEGTWIGPNVTIFDYVKIGKNCRIFPGAVIGAIPQDLKFNGEVTYVEIGDNTTVRECATINRGTAASGKYKTVVGNDCLIMSYCHIAHDCRVGNHCIMSSYAGIAGETDIEDWAIIGGSTVAHQFSRIGQHAMVSGASAIAKDIPPYTLSGRNPIVFEGINIVGLRRRGFSNDTILEIQKIYETLYNSGLNISDACRKIEAEFQPSPERDAILTFIAESKRGIIKKANV